MYVSNEFSYCSCMQRLPRSCWWVTSRLLSFWKIWNESSFLRQALFISWHPYSYINRYYSRLELASKVTKMIEHHSLRVYPPCQWAADTCISFIVNQSIRERVSCAIKKRMSDGCYYYQRCFVPKFGSSGRPTCTLYFFSPSFKMSSLSVLEAKLEAESKAFQQLQKGSFYSLKVPLMTGIELTRGVTLELSSAIESRQRLDSQQQENEVVRKVITRPMTDERLLILWLWMGPLGIWPLGRWCQRVQAYWSCPRQARKGWSRNQCEESIGAYFKGNVS